MNACEQSLWGEGGGELRTSQLAGLVTNFSLDVLNSVAVEVSKCDVTWDESQYDDIQRNTAFQHCYG